MRKQTIKAVHELDLRQLLEDLGLYDLMEKVELTCGICGAPIGLENLLCVYPSGDDVKVCCKNLGCYERVLMEIRQ